MKFLEKVMDWALDLPDWVKSGAAGFVFGLIFGLIL